MSAPHPLRPSLDRAIDSLIERAGLAVHQRSINELERRHGCTERALARSIVVRAVRDSGRVGAAGGAIGASQWLVPPSLVAVPMELLAETIATAIVELRLIADLHTVYGISLPASDRERALVLVQAWAEQRGVSTSDLSSLPMALSSSGRRSLRHRLLMRAFRNIGSFTPMFIGAAIGARINRAETRRLAQAVEQDLALRQSRH